MNRALAWWHLSRPALLPFLLLLPFFGYAFAHWDRALQMQNGAGLLWVFAAWVSLNAGTMWLNAELDRDEGDVLLGRAVPVPPHTSTLAYAALALCVPLSWQGSAVAGGAALLCAALSVLYSHPSTAWKGHPVLGPLVNVLGYGLLSPLAGWAVVGVPANPRTLVAWGFFGIGILSPYLLAQAFQGDEDRARGYRTAVVALGPRRTLQLARLTMGVVMLGGFGLALVGWFPRLCLVALPLGLWIDDLLRRWAALPDGGSSRWALRYARRVLVSIVLLVGLSFVEYIQQSYEGVPVAGLGTVSGRPSDRPHLPPRQMRIWEATHGAILRD